MARLTEVDEGARDVGYVGNADSGWVNKSWWVNAGIANRGSTGVNKFVE